MLIRIVRMTLQPDALKAFLEHFDAAAPQIRAFEGCRHLALWQDARFRNICATHSHWDDAEALKRYRQSAFFRRTWGEVKPFFAAAPAAHSYELLRLVRG